MSDSFPTNMFLSVLDEKRTELLLQLGTLKEYEFYLAGGTALALQIGHRTSLDFDFYTEKEFDGRKLRQECDREFRRVRETYIANDTLGLLIDDIAVSFFKYPYPLIRPLRRVGGVNMASMDDIAAMKVIAISQRGLRRDFIDIYFLMKEFGLRKIMDLTTEKYSMFNIYVGLEGLVYFKDADSDPGKERFRLLKEVNWERLKSYILKEVDRVRSLL